MFRVCAVLFITFIFTIAGCSFIKKLFDKRPLPEIEKVYIKGGTFKMGDVVEGENGDALPTHKVTLKDYYLTKYEITYAQYDLFAENSQYNRPTSGYINRGNRAVAFVTWQEARAFCHYVGMRLPTEQEWEYAARERGKKLIYPGTNSADSLDLYARHDENSYQLRTFPVGTKKPNALGLYDMAGNAYEWIGRFYQFYPEEGEDAKWDPLEPDGVRIIRGGSYMSKQNKNSNDVNPMKTWWRVGTLADTNTMDTGFRCAETANSN